MGRGGTTGKKADFVSSYSITRFVMIHKTFTDIAEDYCLSVSMSLHGFHLRINVSFMTKATTTPERRVRPPIMQIAHLKPNASARTPAVSAPTA